MRLLLKNADVPDFVSGFIDDQDELLKHRTVLIKLHRFRSDIAAKADIVLTSHRDLRDVVASAHRKFQTKFSTLTVNDWVKHYIKWTQYAVYDMHYEQLLVDRLAELKRVASVLQLPQKTLDRLPYEAILREVEGEKFVRQVSEGTPHDTVNLLHKDHITDGRHGSWKNVVPEEFIVAIEKEFRGWLTHRGYSVSHS